MRNIRENLRERNISLPTIRRFPAYLRLLRKMYNAGNTIVSGNTIANVLGIEPILVRKDLTSTGIVGKPRVGYNTQELIDGIESTLHWNKKHKAVAIGAGHLASALISYSELKSHGIEILAAFDVDDTKVGQTIKGIPIQHIDGLVGFCLTNNIQIALLCTPETAVVEIESHLQGTNIKGVWNFTSFMLEPSNDYTVVNEDLSSGFAILSSQM